MTTFIRLLSESDKCGALQETTLALRNNRDDKRIFRLAPSAFRNIPGAPFAYWSTENIRALFDKLSPFEEGERLVRQGLSTADDFRYVRCWWEVQPDTIFSGDPVSAKAAGNRSKWVHLLKGGGRSAFVNDLDLVLNYRTDGKELKAWVSSLYGNSGWSRNVVSTELYYRRGFSWSLRSSRFSPSAVPDGCIFSASRYQAFVEQDDLPWAIALLNSRIVSFILRMCSEWFERPKYVVGIVSKLPIPNLDEQQKLSLSKLFADACSLKLQKLAFDERSHYFQKPAAANAGLGLFDSSQEVELIIDAIDHIANSAYGLGAEDVLTINEMLPPSSDKNGTVDIGTDDFDDADDACPTESGNSGYLLWSWAIGVGFGRFDIRMATGERVSPPEPDPFAPLLACSPGMLPKDGTPFHVHGGILTDDSSHPHDLPRLIETILEWIKAPVSQDVRAWLRKEFFPFHLQQYSKSRRKAPIYWPLSTASGAYTLWLYYPSLSSQTLYTALNDFVEPKLHNVTRNLTTLREKGSTRSSAENKEFVTLQDLQIELIEFRNTLQELAPTYRPNHDDGVQISAAILWPLFRHKPWQKVLKDTWEKLKNGDYDWAHLAMNYWPERVREKCKTDKSLAIAHGLEELFVEPAASDKPKRSRKPKET